MKRQARRVRVTTTALTQPVPNFVSAVWAGANQLPWTALKGADAVLTIKTEELAMTLKTLKEAGVEIAQIVFAADKFADEASVTKWLEEGGYGEFEIAKADDGSFVVKSVSEFVGDMRQIEADGMILTVGALKASVEAAEKAAADAVPAPAPEVTVVDAEDVQPVAKADEPASTETVIEAIPVATQKSLYGVMNVHDLVCNLKYIIEEANYDVFYGRSPDAGQNIDGLKSAANTLIGVMAQMFAVETDKLQAYFATMAQASADLPVADVVPAPTEDAAGGAEAAKEDEPAAPAADEPAPEVVEEEITDPVMKFMAAEFAKITKSVEGLTGQVSDVSTKQDALGARVDGIEAGRPVAAPQTRKSADVDEASTSSTDQADAVKAKSKSIGDLVLNGGLGISVQRFKGQPGSRSRD